MKIEERAFLTDFTFLIKPCGIGDYLARSDKNVRKCLGHKFESSDVSMQYSTSLQSDGLLKGPGRWPPYKRNVFRFMDRHTSPSKSIGKGLLGHKRNVSLISWRKSWVMACVKGIEPHLCIGPELKVQYA